MTDQLQTLTASLPLADLMAALEFLPRKLPEDKAHYNGVLRS